MQEQTAARASPHGREPSRRWALSRAQACQESLLHGAPCSGPPSGTTCLKKPGAGCGLARTPCQLRDAGKPALFFTQTLTQGIISLCVFFRKTWWSQRKYDNKQNTLSSKNLLSNLPQWQKDDEIYLRLVWTRVGAYVISSPLVSEGTKVKQNVS